MDREAARQALKAGECARALCVDLGQTKRYGTGGVPFFAQNEKYGLSGAQEPETFLNGLEALVTER